MAEKKPHINLIFTGHVDHGKSTTIGRLFFETGIVSEQDLIKFKKLAEEVGKGTWEYAYAVDLTKEERKRGLTIDLAEKRFDTKKYYFTIIDAPGHKDFIKNMITGASQADAAVLVVAASDGIMPQTKEHAFLLKVMGVKQIIVDINKMDAVKYDEKRFNEVKDQMEKLFKSIGISTEGMLFLATSAIGGDNIAKKSDKMAWYKGKTLLESFDTLSPPKLPTDKPLRIPIEDSYSITGIGTVPVGKVISGKMKIGDKVVFLPSGASGEVKSIEMHHEQIKEAIPGDNIGFNVRGVDKKSVKRGDICSHVKDAAKIVKKFVAQIIVLEHPSVIASGYTPVFHTHTSQVACRFDKILKKLDPKTGATLQENPDFIKAGDAAIVEIIPTKPFIIEKKEDLAQLSSFAVRDMGRTVAAGVCIDILKTA